MIKLLISDLDDTLYSWIGFFIPAFYAMSKEVARIIGVSEDTLLAEYKVIHQQKGNVEHPYSTLLLPSVKAAFPSYSDEQIKMELDSAFHQFNSIRKEKLCLFPTVYDTLELLDKMHIKIVGYTDSANENGYYRLKKLNIDAFFSEIYVSAGQVEHKKHSDLCGKVKTVNKKKPNPELLKCICCDQGVKLSEAIYVGDSLTKDILMAKKAGIFAVLFKPEYSDFDLNDYYKKLIEISHWLPEDYEREAQLKKEYIDQGITPDRTINSFDQIICIIKEKEFMK